MRRVYDQVANNDSGDSDEVQQFNTFRSRLNRRRAEFVPPLPIDIDDVDIQGEWAKTQKGRLFLNKLDNNWGMAVFTTSRLLKALQQCTCVYVDGTFKTAPNPYVQFLSIHGLYNGFVVPLVFCLVDGKSIGQYRQILQQLKQEILRKTGMNWNPQQVVLDFEQAMLLAIQTELPGTKLSGCYFHFTQNLWRHIQEEGLVRAYRTSKTLRTTVKKVMAIGFLPTMLVRQNFDLLRNTNRTQRLVQRFPQLDDWLDYVQNTYINRNSLFPPSVWNIYKRSTNTRTNNHLEGIVYIMIG